jgi:hypothetical protein
MRLPQFFSITSRTRDQHKLKLVKIVHAASMGELPRNADWRAASFLLERGWPLEFAPVYRDQVTPPAPDEKKKVSVAFIFETGGKTIAELTNFPVHGDLSPPKDEPTSQEASSAHAPQRRPVVGAGGKVVRWTDASESQDEADADADADLP